MNKFGKQNHWVKVLYVNAYSQNRRQQSSEDLYKIADILDMEAKELVVEAKNNK